MNLKYLHRNQPSLIRTVVFEYNNLSLHTTFLYSLKHVIKCSTQSHIHSMCGSLLDSHLSWFIFYKLHIIYLLWFCVYQTLKLN